MTPTRTRACRAAQATDGQNALHDLREQDPPSATRSGGCGTRGLCIVNRCHQPYVVENANCRTTTEVFQHEGKERHRMVMATDVGEVSLVEEMAGFTALERGAPLQKPGGLQGSVRDRGRRTLQGRRTKASRTRRNGWGDDVILRAGVGSFPLHHIMIHWMGIETFAMEWMENRDEILKLEAIMRERRRALYPILADAPITHANFGGNEVPEVMGRSRYEEFCVPMANECAEAFHARGKLVGSHLDGNNKPWADVVAASGFDLYRGPSPPAPTRT